MQPFTEHPQPRRGMALHNSIRHWQELPTSNGCAKLWNPRVYESTLRKKLKLGLSQLGVCPLVGQIMQSYAKYPFIGSSMFLLLVVLSDLDSGLANGRSRTKNPVRLKEAEQLWVPKNVPQEHPRTMLAARSQQQLYQTS